MEPLHVAQFLSIPVKIFLRFCCITQRSENCNCQVVMKCAQVYLILVGLLFASSCCKTYCTDEMLLVSFQQFKRQDVDTTYFISYQKDSGFTQKTDSVADIKTVDPGDTLNSAEIKILEVTKDWVVKIPALNKTYYFSNYHFSSERCNCDHNKFQKITSVSVNGVVIPNSFIILQ